MQCPQIGHLIKPIQFLINPSIILRPFSCILQLPLTPTLSNLTVTPIQLFINLSTLNACPSILPYLFSYQQTPSYDQLWTPTLQSYLFSYKIPSYRLPKFFVIPTSNYFPSNNSCSYFLLVQSKYFSSSSSDLPLDSFLKNPFLSTFWFPFLIFQSLLGSFLIFYLFDNILTSLTPFSNFSPIPPLSTTLNPFTPSNTTSSPPPSPSLLTL
jgi:hypothetical protein